jgi:D-serine dehydratase
MIDIPAAVRDGEPTVWRNPARRPASEVLAASPLHWDHVEQAIARWRRFAPLLAILFPELRATGGHIDSPLLPADAEFAHAVLGGSGRVGIKADHDLPVTGCIKARGGVYEVLWYAEQVARQAGLREEFAVLAGPAWRDLFATHTVVVGSTGNLGYSVGVMARALGFAAEVHMSSDAKAWKKDRLRRIGVEVVEHAGDYTAAVASARTSSEQRPRCHFVDDESSVHLFLGYATAALDVHRQLDAAHVRVDGAHPLIVYLPCGVGGAPGGLTFGLKHVFGDAVRCVFVEPVDAPCMLVQLASGESRAVSVYDVGRTNRTIQDGLAVASASLFAAGMVRHLIEGIVTVTDAQALDWVKRTWEDAGLRVEPSAAAAMAAVMPWCEADPGFDRASATHLLWTTGGGLLPDEVFLPLIGG